MASISPLCAGPRPQRRALGRVGWVPPPQQLRFPGALTVVTRAGGLFGLFGSRKPGDAVKIGERTIVGADADAWEACLDLLRGAGLSGDGARVALERAFAWAGRGPAYWRGDRLEEVPRPEAVAAVLDFLAGPPLGLDGDDVKAVLIQFPECLACDIQGTCRLLLFGRGGGELWDEGCPIPRLRLPALRPATLAAPFPYPPPTSPCRPPAILQSACCQTLPSWSPSGSSRAPRSPRPCDATPR